MMRDSDGRDIITMGCIDDNDRAQLNCHVGSQSYVAIQCCNNVSFCNRRLIPRYVTDNSAAAYHVGDTAPGMLHDIDMSVLSCADQNVCLVISNQRILGC